MKHPKKKRHVFEWLAVATVTVLALAAVAEGIGVANVATPSS
jgi:hypothetical protein